MDTSFLVQILVGLAVINVVTTVAVLPSLTRVEKKLADSLRVIDLIQNSQSENSRNMMDLIKELIAELARRGHTR